MFLILHYIVTIAYLLYYIFYEFLCIPKYEFFKYFTYFNRLDNGPYYSRTREKDTEIIGR